MAVALDCETDILDFFKRIQGDNRCTQRLSEMIFQYLIWIFLVLYDILLTTTYKSKTSCAYTLHHKLLI